MGVVYKAREVALDRLVALKVVTAGHLASAEQLARFRSEARAEARLQHPHIVQVHAVGEHEGFPFLSLEYMDGGNLAQKIARQPQPPREAAHVVYLLARAMAFAHQRGIVHRDLKPANVLLKNNETTKDAKDTKDTKSRGEKETRSKVDDLLANLSSDSFSRASGVSWFDTLPKIADFGLAKCLEDESSYTRTGTLMGTPNYMSPEQAQGSKDSGPATDLWALGVVLYEMLIGRTPFQGVTMMDTLEQVRTREPVPPTQLQPKVPIDLETICLKCLRKEPNQRYASADQLAEDLRRFLDGEPIRARPIGSFTRLLLWSRRNPRVAVLSALVLLLLLAVAVVSTGFVFVLESRRREIESAWRQARENEQTALRHEQRADANAREAFERYQLLHEALTVVIDRVQKDLKVFPQTSAVRRQILEATIKVLRRSVAQTRDSTRQPERSLAAAYMIMGDVLLEQKKTDEAIQNYNQCHEILKVLYQANPENDKAAGNYAASLSRQGDIALDHRHDAAEALKLYQQALNLQEHSLTNPPAQPELTPTEIRRAIANSHQRIGEILRRTQPRNLNLSRAHFEKAREYLEQVVPVENTLGNYIRLEQVTTQLAQINEQQNRRDEALRANERCLEACKKLVEYNPSSTGHLIQIARLCGKIGDTYLLAGDTSTAKRYYEEAVSVNEQLVRRENQPGLKVLLSLNYYRRATAFLRQGDRVHADEDYKKCLDLRVGLLRQSPQNQDLQIDLMIAQGRCGLHREAAAYARELRQRYPNNSTYLIHAACGYALSAFGVEHEKTAGTLTAEEKRLRQEYCHCAVEALQRAKSIGYDDVKNLQTEPDLDPIRADHGFQALLREYTATDSEPRP
jgi:serine/threonine protein kinase/predicted negative regulator of RcsB-dependent stress response